MGQLAFLRMFILVAISLDVNDNRRHVHIFKKGMRHQHSLHSTARRPLQLILRNKLIGGQRYV